MDVVCSTVSPIRNESLKINEQSESIGKGPLYLNTDCEFEAI